MDYLSRAAAVTQAKVQLVHRRDRKRRRLRPSTRIGCRHRGRQLRRSRRYCSTSRHKRDLYAGRLQFWAC